MRILAILFAFLLVLAPRSMANGDRPGSEDSGVSILDSINEELSARGLNARVSKMEYFAIGEGRQGQTVFANDRTLQLGTRWVPGDSRRGAVGDDITYLVDKSDGVATGGLANSDTESAIDRAMATWDTVSCSKLDIVKNTDFGQDPDIVDGFLGFGLVGNPFLADITQAGWLPKGFFDALTPGGGDFILGVTFTFIFVAGGNPTDVDDNGFLDTALKEIYYNNNFPWAINAAFPIDVETVALHEAGHSLELGHFGKIFRTDRNGKIHFAPRSVMNGPYSGIQQTLVGTDKAALCTLFAQWPHR